MKKELLNCVAVSNEFARYAEINLSLIEWKLLLYMISRIKKHEILFLYEKVKLIYFTKIMGVSTTSVVKKAAESLVNTTVCIKDKTYSIFDSLTVDNKTITYKFNEEMRPHLLGLSDNMTIFDLGSIYSMKSKYTIRMFIFGMSFRHMTYYNCAQDDFKKIVGFDKSKSELERRILFPALDEINENTNIFLHARFKDDRYYFAATEKTDKQKQKYRVDEWKNLIEDTRDFSEISKDIFSDLNFEEL